MLLNRSKVQTARLKISELKRKYSSETILKQNESFPQQQRNYSNDDMPNLEHFEHYKSSTDSRSIYDHCLDNSSFDATINTLTEQTIQSFGENFSFSKPSSNKESNLKHGCTSVSSSKVCSPRSNNDEPSYEFPQIVNQLDNLCFISSSTDEQIKTIADLNSSNEQNNFKKTKIFIDKTIMLPSGESSTKLESDPIEICDLLKHSEFASEKCSPIPSSSKSKLENIILEYSYSNTFTDSSCKTSLEDHELYNLESSIIKASKKSNESTKDIQQTNLCKREGILNEFKIDGNNIKECRKEKLIKVTEKCGGSTNEESYYDIDVSEKWKLNKNLNSKHNNADSDSKILTIEIIDSKIKDTRKNRAGKKSQGHHSNTKPQPNVGFNESVKRPVLKSSKLIQNNKPMPNMIFSCEQYQPFATSRAGHLQCEQIISNLLLNQIQLSHHFINSHHNMYLLCCQAAKKLSKDYIKRHSLPNRGIRR